jgi:hypothetical protein
MLEKLRRSLASFDAFNEPFQAVVQSRLLLFPTDGFLLTPKQFKALGTVASQFGDRTGHCVITEGLDVSKDQVALDCYEFNLQDYAGYRNLGDSGCVLQENALLSDSGSWVILISQEFHALLGCPLDFLVEFRRLYPEADSEFDKFVDAWKSNAERIGSDISWLPNLAAHLRSR